MDKSMTDVLWVAVSACLVLLVSALASRRSGCTTRR